MIGGGVVISLSRGKQLLVALGWSGKGKRVPLLPHPPTPLP